MYRHIAGVLFLALLLPTVVLAQKGTSGWSTYKKYDKWFHYSQTKVTPEGEPHLTCIDGSGTTFALGSRGRGLFKFDTRRRRFEHYPGVSRFIHKQITAVAMGPGRDELWVGTYFSGLHHLQNGRWEVFTERDGLPGSRIVCLKKGKNTVWIGTNKGVAYINNGQISKTNVTRKVESLSYDQRSGRVYAGHAKSHISVYDPQRNAWSTIKMAVEPPVTFKHLLVEPSGDILVGTFLGLFRISGRTGKVTDLTRSNEKKLISCLELGEDGKVYVGIFGKNKGMHILEGDELKSLFRAYSGYSETSGFKRTRNGDWLIVSFGRLWHFTDQFIKDGTLVKVDYRVSTSGTKTDLDTFVPPATSTPTELSNLPPPPDDGAPSPQPTRRVVTPPNLPRVNIPSTPPKKLAGFTKVLDREGVSALTQSVGRLWVGTDRGNLYLMPKAGQLKKARTFNGPVSNLFYSSGGRLYIVAERNKIFTFNGFSYRLTLTARDDITALADYPNGGLYVGTRGGLFRTDGERLVPVTATGQLPDRAITALLVNGSDLWVGTRLGLAKLSGGRYTVYSTADGLPSADVRSLASFQGRVYCGTSAGVAGRYGERFRSTGSAAALSMRAAGNQLWVAREQSLTKFANNQWGQSVGSPLGRINTILPVGADVAVGTEQGLLLVPQENVK
jgi:ligand-binding sensor domain-containing protein